eukprot:COSAG01_NODE_1316_length_10755_cov_4.749343_6_plen_56_part_00
MERGAEHERREQHSEKVLGDQHFLNLRNMQMHIIAKGRWWACSMFSRALHTDATP